MTISRLSLPTIITTSADYYMAAQKRLKNWAEEGGLSFARGRLCASFLPFFRARR